MSVAESPTFPGEACAEETSLGQIMLDGVWVDYARGTLGHAILWASGEPEGTARVVDWIDKKHVLWPLPSILDALPED